MRHIIGLSGGKDSSALIIYLKETRREIFNELEPFFCDTGAELKETYDYLNKLENYLGIKIKMLGADKPFDVLLKENKGFLPNHRARWCTRMMKLKPMFDFIGKDACTSYVGIRADEAQRTGFKWQSEVENVFPFIEDGLVKDDIFEILKGSGLGVPSYYDWRTRSGCYFCFYQRKIEWVGLLENHPELFEKAQQYEKDDFTWIKDMPLEEFKKPHIVKGIKERHAKKMAMLETKKNQISLFEDVVESEQDVEPCRVCSL